jgi:hypothetical protein
MSRAVAIVARSSLFCWRQCRVGRQEALSSIKLDCCACLLPDSKALTTRTETPTHGPQRKTFHIVAPAGWSAKCHAPAASELQASDQTWHCGDWAKATTEAQAGSLGDAGLTPLTVAALGHDSSFHQEGHGVAALTSSRCLRRRMTPNVDPSRHEMARSVLTGIIIA